MPAQLIHRCSPTAVAMLAVVFFVTGCQHSAPTVERTGEPQADQLKGTPFDPGVDHPYVLCPGDKLLIRFPTDATLDQEVHVRSDGKITLPYIGDIKASHRSPEELASEINEKLQAVLRNPRVAVIVTEETGRVVFINGQVVKPGALALRPAQTLLRSIIEVGGTTSLSNTDQVLVLRTTPNDGTYILTANLKQILAGKSADIPLQPLDIVHVPDTVIAQVDLFVEQYFNAIMPRTVSFPFTTQLHNEPLKVIGDNSSDVAPIQITR